MPFQPKYEQKDQDYYIAFLLTLKSLQITATSKSHAVCVYKQLRRDKFMERLVSIYNKNEGVTPMSAKSAAQYFNKTFCKHERDYNSTLQIDYPTQNTFQSKKGRKQ